MTASPATDAAARLLSSLIAHGVQDVVLAPGSRSQALALAATHFARQASLRVHVRIDERVAGFTALGIARESGRPAAVVCTSGTAVANLLPAAQEAFHSGIPMLLLTADRPPELRGVAANQTTTQPGMFDAWAQFATDAPVPGDDEGFDWEALGARAVAIATGADAGTADVSTAPRPAAGVAGPVHLNLPTREPLSAVLPDAVTAVPGPLPEHPAPVAHLLAQGPRTVVVAGAGAGPEAAALAARAGWPLIAEIVSGARVDPAAVPEYRAALRDPDRGGRIERAVVLGHPTLSREVTALLRRDDIEVIAVRFGGVALDLNGRTRAVDAVDVEAGGPADGDADAWLRAWGGASAVPPASASPASALDRPSLVTAVWRASRPDDRLVFGSSRLVRVADELLAPRDVRVHANRGLAGIDGTIATAFGVARAVQSAGGAGTTRLLLGDLAFLHDVGALLLAPGEPLPRLQVIVGNDGGGTIFDGLEVASSAPADDLRRAFYTPHAVRLGQLAAAYGWEHVVAEERIALDRALVEPQAVPRLIEVPLAR